MATRSEKIQEERNKHVHLDQNGELALGNGESLVWKGKPDFHTDRRQTMRRERLISIILGSGLNLTFWLLLFFIIPTDLYMSIVLYLLLVTYPFFIYPAYRIILHFRIKQDESIEYVVTNLGAYVKNGQSLIGIRWHENLQVEYSYISEHLIDIRIYNKDDFSIVLPRKLNPKEQLVRTGHNEEIVEFARVSCEDPIIGIIHAEYTPDRVLSVR